MHTAPESTRSPWVPPKSYDRKVQFARHRRALVSLVAVARAGHIPTAAPRPPTYPAVSTPTAAGNRRWRYYCTRLMWSENERWRAGDKSAGKD
ncbi:hypothetical protein EDC01DRAFT_783085 [Geopyxis carbonaria]|nr:hypothetical protein EDC01DRAFT_783085 [Geopyxis carbonaria]